MKTRLTTQGFDEYLEALARAGRDVDRVTDRALAAGGELLRQGMVLRAPKLTGKLAGEIKVSDPVQDGNYHYVEVGLLRDADKDVLRYGHVQEYGSTRTPAQPYLRPTFDEDLRKARKLMREIFVAESLL